MCDALNGISVKLLWDMAWQTIARLEIKAEIQGEKRQSREKMQADTE